MSLLDSSFARLFTLITVSLICAVVVRSLVVKKYGLYLFLVWNIFLATVSAAIMPLFVFLQGHVAGWPLAVSLLASGVIWLLFLPNAFYLLTDMMHLNENVVVTERDDKFTAALHYVRGDKWFIYEGFMIMLLVLFGSFTGGYAINGMHEFLRQHYTYLALPVTSLALLASAFGVYIGRFGRWNSWDILARPRVVLKDSATTFFSKKERGRLLVICLTILLFEVFSWVFVGILRG